MRARPRASAAGALLLGALTSHSPSIGISPTPFAPIGFLVTWQRMLWRGRRTRELRPGEDAQHALTVALQAQHAFAAAGADDAARDRLSDPTWLADRVARERRGLTRPELAVLLAYFGVKYVLGILGRG